MRIKALTLGDTPVKNMANGASETLINIPKNEIITLTGLKRDGANTYYLIEEYNGYIKKDYLKILRDEEFYYSSPLLRTKANRSSTSFFTMARNSDKKEPVIEAAKNAAVEYITNQGEKWLGIGDSSNAITASSLIPRYDPNKTAAQANAAGAKNDAVKKEGMSGIEVSQHVTGIGVGLLNKFTSVGDSKAGTMAMNMLGEFASTGSWESANNLDLGDMFGGTAGEILNGMTISNLSDGTFFTDVLKKNTSTVVTSYLNTLLAKLNYVVGFNLSGSLIHILSGFGVAQNSPIVKELNKIWKPTFSFESYANLDEKIKKYFRYKGANYKMITRWSTSGQHWEQEAYFTTPTLSSKKDPDQVKAHKTIYENLYTDFEKSLNILRDTINMNIDKNDWFINFNRYRLMHPDSVLSNSKGYIFFTRPDLNIGQQIAASDVGLLFFNMASQHPLLAKELTKAFSGNHQFMPLLSNRCTGLDIQDENLETKELGETLTGWKLNYGMNLIKSKSANTVTTSFIDDESLSIYLMFKLWCEYISAVSRGITSPKAEYIRKKQLDYAISIYYFLTAQDGESIIFWTKYTGCIPTIIPSSNFSDSIDNPIRMPKYSITWQYAFKKDYDPYSLAEFNRLTGNDFRYENIYNSEISRSSPTLVGAPFVDTADGSKTFKLRFRRKYQ